MVLVRWEDMRNENNLAVQSDSRRLANSVRQGFCRLRRDSPTFRLLVQGGSQPEIPTIARAYRSFLDGICSDIPAPPSENVPVGGQCAVPYRVFAEVIGTNGTVIYGTGTPGVLVTGPIRSLYWNNRRERNVNNVLVWRVELFVVDSSASPQPKLIIGDGGGSASLEPATWQARLTRADGLPDNCGDPPPPPPTQLPAPQPFVNIDVNLGGLTVPLRFNFGDFNFNDWPDFVFRPAFNTDLGGITFSLEGIELPDFPQLPDTGGDTGDTVTNTTLNQQLTQQTTIIESTLNQQITQLTDAIEIDLDKVLELIRACCCEEDVTFETNTLTPVSSGNRFDLSSNVVAVVVSTVSIDRTRVRMQRGGGNTNDVYYWGWVSINYGAGSDGVRQQLAYDVQSVPCMDGATSVTVSPHFGTTFNAVEIVKNKNIPTH